MSADIITLYPNDKDGNWEVIEVFAETASNHWERGFQAGLRLGEKGIAKTVDRIHDWLAESGPANPVSANDYEILRLLRQIDKMLNPQGEVAP